MATFRTLTLSNMDQGGAEAAGLIIAADKASFRVTVPAAYREQPCTMTFMGGVSSSEDETTSTTCLDGPLLLFHHDIPTNSFSSETGGSDRQLGYAVYSTADLTAPINPAGSLWVGSAVLPPTITISRLRYNATNGLLEPASAFAGGTYKQIPMQVTLGLRFE